LAEQKGKTSADVAELNGLPPTQSADLPVRPFGARPAEPAFAAGAPPDAPGATPARALLAFSAIILLCSAMPVAARCIDRTTHRAEICRAKPSQSAVTPPTRKAAPPVTVVLKSAGGGSFSHWRPIAADLMP
jgi:hypothetical protein